MHLPSVNSIYGVIFYGVISSIIATILLFLFRRLVKDDSMKQSNKQKISGTNIVNITQSPSSIVSGGVQAGNEGKTNK